MILMIAKNINSEFYDWVSNPIRVRKSSGNNQNVVKIWSGN